MKEYQVTLTGKTPLLMHQDNIEWADFMSEWINNPENKKASKAGDDRTPAWRWIGAAYHDGNLLGLPQGNIMRSLMEGGAMVPTGKGNKTFKAQTQSGMMSVNPFWHLTTKNNSHIQWADIEPLRQVESFSVQKEQARELGFDLFVKRAKIGSSKHIRVRPIFDAGWKLTGTIAVWDKQITKVILEQILEYAGQYKGLGDWRPGGKTPGPYGMFSAEVK
ncbi:MAG: hypothetical protein KME67_05150 [Candidatus Thiodiazotropha sp. (ex Codakia orbicularis)]|nr:hypothetical protein [Candidatus Thiodiazotropha sp. (ex Codakia orbicularis)]